jgi:hypothetical protein
MFAEDLVMTGRLQIALNGEVVKEVPNLVVTAGKEYVASRIKDTTKNAMSHMAVGTSSTSPGSADTTLGSEANRQLLTSTTVTSNTVTYVATFDPGEGTGALAEAGIFNDASAGDMLCRTTFAVINKGAADSMTITWVITVS